MSSIPHFKLNTGAEIPAIALGTWESPNSVAADAVFEAIKAGYRHIDTAAVYGNEVGVGGGIARAIKELGVRRSDLFVTTKLWCTDFLTVPSAFYTSLAKIFPGDPNAYFDLYLMHWPKAMIPGTDKYDDRTNFNEVYAEMEKLPKKHVKAIGVSNFTVNNLKKLLETANVTPATNQVELHTRLPQTKLVNFLLEGKYGNPKHDGKVIIPQAYSPMARGNLSDSTIEKIAEKYGCSPANIVLSWGVQRKTNVLPKSVHAERIRANFKFIDLAKEDVDTINNISKESDLQRYCSFPCSDNIDVFENNADSK